MQTHPYIPINKLFQNLMGNAIKSLGKEALRVHISAERKDNAWVFSVRDNGIGIEPKAIERIFDVFQRLQFLILSSARYSYIVSIGLFSSAHSDIYLPSIKQLTLHESVVCPPCILHTWFPARFHCHIQDIWYFSSFMFSPIRRLQLFH